MYYLFKGHQDVSLDVLFCDFNKLRVTVPLACLFVIELAKVSFDIQLGGRQSSASR